MMRNKIKIKILGLTNTGKTTIAQIIEEALTRLDIECVIEDQDLDMMTYGAVLDFRAQQGRRVHYLKDKGLTVNIETINSRCTL